MGKALVRKTQGPGVGGMIGGVHTILFSRKADAVRAFLRDVLEFPFVDAGDGWLIFASPPGEIAVHPTRGKGNHELYLMCKDIRATLRKLRSRGVRAEPATTQGWGLLSRVELPDGQPLGLYEPRHPMAIRMRGTGKTVRKTRAR